MRKLILILAFLVAGCGTVPNPVTRSRIDTLNASWGLTLAVANGYYDTCERRLIAPTCRTYVAYMQSVVPVVQKKVERAREFAKNPSVSPIDLINVASDAVNDLKIYMSDHGVK